MKYLVSLVVVCLIAVPYVAGQPKHETLVTGLKHPAGVAVGPGRKIYVTIGGDQQKKGTGAVVIIENGNAVPFATGLNQPNQIVAFQTWLFVTDQQQIWRIDAKGKAEVFVPTTAFPATPHELIGLAVDPESGTLYVSDHGDVKKEITGAIYRVTPRGKVSLVADAIKMPQIDRPVALLLDGQSHLIVTGHNSAGAILRIKLADGTTEQLAEKISGSGLAWDNFGRLFVSNLSNLFAIPRPGHKPISLKEMDAGAICLDPSGKNILVVDRLRGTLTAVPISIPGHEVDDTPLPLHTEVAFPDLQWAGWKGETDSGKINPLRPLLLTHAGDGSNRVFVATEQGVIHSFPNDQKAKSTTVCLDLPFHLIIYRAALGCG